MFSYDFLQPCNYFFFSLSRVVLFVDEADAFLRKRSEVRRFVLMLILLVTSRMMIISCNALPDSEISC